MRKERFLAVAVIVVFYLFLELMGITCPILYVTGISCAGCGMSRAWLSLLKLDIAEAFSYHPLFWLPMPAAVLLLFQRRIPERIFRWGIGIVCALFLLVYLYRLLFLEDQIVVFQPDQGLIVQIILDLVGMRA